jgi:DNA-binding Lrp family transcriptional regulator
MDVGKQVDRMVRRVRRLELDGVIDEMTAEERIESLQQMQQDADVAGFLYGKPSEDLIRRLRCADIDISRF